MSEPAFPTGNEHPNNRPSDPQKGMTLRDYFAAKAMAVCLQTFNDPPPDEHWRIGIAIDAYRMADAMLKARIKGK